MQIYLTMRTNNFEFIFEVYLKYLKYRLLHEDPTVWKTVIQLPVQKEIMLNE